MATAMGFELVLSQTVSVIPLEEACHQQRPMQLLSQSLLRLRLRLVTRSALFARQIALEILSVRWWQSSRKPRGSGG